MTQEELMRSLVASNPSFKEEMLMGNFEDDEFTDEARTNEDQYEGQNFFPNSTKYGAFGHIPGHGKVPLETEGSSERFYEQQEGSESSGEQQDDNEDEYYEEGEIDPNMQQILAEREESGSQTDAQA